MTPAKPTDKNAGAGRRRVPRRTFKAPVGVLKSGGYAIRKAYQLGEGGMMIDHNEKLKEGVCLVLNFFLPGGHIVMVRGIVRAVIAAKDGQPERYGLEFLNLGFQYKRAIRNFVAAATREDGHSAFQTYY
jgi:hypothetical protein